MPLQIHIELFTLYHDIYIAFISFVYAVCMTSRGVLLQEIQVIQLLLTSLITFKKAFSETRGKEVKSVA